MREGDEVKARDLAYDVLLKEGCSPAALDALKPTEASDAVWLMAAQFARDWHGADWEFFVRPGNIPHGETYFVGKYDAVITDEAERIAHDKKALTMWLDYARKRIKQTERRLLVHELATGFTNPAARRLVREKASSA